MERYLGRLAPYFYAILRIVAGLMFATHGTQKLFGRAKGRRAATRSASSPGSSRPAAAC